MSDLLYPKVRIREARERRGWSQEELGNKMGVSGSYISQVERGTRIPGSDTLLRFGDVFDVSLDWLMGRVDTEGGMLPNIDLRADEWAVINAIRTGEFAKVMELIGKIAQA